MKDFDNTFSHKLPESVLTPSELIKIIIKGWDEGKITSMGLEGCSVTDMEWFNRECEKRKIVSNLKTDVEKTER